MARKTTKKKKPVKKTGVKVSQELVDDILASHPEPVLRDEAILGKPPSAKEQDIDAHIQATMEFLDTNPNMSEVIINLSKFYKAYLNPQLPGIADDMKPVMLSSLTSLELVVSQPARKPRLAFLRQLLLPCAYGSVQAFTEGVRAYLVPIAPGGAPLFHGDTEVTERLAVEMDFDIMQPHRPQLLKFGREAGVLEEQYCMYRSTGDEDEQEDNV